MEESFCFNSKFSSRPCLFRASHSVARVFSDRFWYGRIEMLPSSTRPCNVSIRGFYTAVHRSLCSYLHKTKKRFPSKRSFARFMIAIASVNVERFPIVVRYRGRARRIVCRWKTSFNLCRKAEGRVLHQGKKVKLEVSQIKLLANFWSASFGSLFACSQTLALIHRHTHTYTAPRKESLSERW